MADYEKQGTGYDSGATGYELQGRDTEPRKIGFGLASLGGMGIRDANAPWKEGGPAHVMTGRPLSIVGDGIGLTTIANPGWPDDHLVTDVMRGRGE